MFAADAVTPVTQAVTFAVVGGLITLATLLINTRSKHQAEKRLFDQRQEMEKERRSEKDADRQAQIDKESRDYARQDLVAERVERATRATLTKLNDVEHLGKVTHALVNSDKTASMKLNLTLMREVADLKRAVGKEPTPEALVAIVELEQAIHDRLAEQKAAEARNAAGGDTEAAEMQIAAAEVQQVAAEQQRAAAAQVANALGPIALPPPPPPP